MGGHEDAQVPDAGWTDAEARQVRICFRVDDAVPVLFCCDTARTRLEYLRGMSDLMKHFEVFAVLLDSLDPGETGPGLAERAPDFLAARLRGARDEEFAEFRLHQLLGAGWANVEVWHSLDRVPVLIARHWDRPGAR